MVLRLQRPILALEPGQVVALDDAAGTRIEARDGTLWVTQEGLVDDHILEAGDSLVVGRGGRTLVQAFTPAWVALQ